MNTLANCRLATLKQPIPKFVGLILARILRRFAGGILTNCHINHFFASPVAWGQACIPALLRRGQACIPAFFYWLRSALLLQEFFR
jgi:hypothetical protein